MEYIYFVLLFVSGVLSGLYGANVGGGAFLSFPVLLLSGIPVHQAIATQRFAALWLELASSIKFSREGKLDIVHGLTLGFFASIGALTGSQLVINVDVRYVNVMVGIVFMVAFIFLLRVNHKKKPGTSHGKLKSKLLLYFFTFLLSIYGGFFGAGFGTLMMLLLVWTGNSFTQSAAMSRIAGLFLCIVSSAIFALSGLIHYPYALTLGTGYAIGGWCGIKLALKKGEGYIKTLLLVVVALTIVKLLLDVFL